MAPKNVTAKLTKIIDRIRAMQEDPIIKNYMMTLFSDFGNEFSSSFTREVLKKKNCQLFVVGGEHKAQFAQILTYGASNEHPLGSDQNVPNPYLC